ncbi:flavanone 3-dioxygenase 2-like [Phragmites australis]|uniref:flavanone 3-dioxygenase 2-like n=1 Tax=Phragmites australis TaxID=29695 RepID=UPI002D79C440|nr:flavanone 3-dioxygenase 2-like [Phragmites australis]XP_062208547.1 flavanone 3-dioxygenase 2-like [Phragmites australis]
MATSGVLPVVDLAPFFTGDEGGMTRATEAMLEACRTLGFFRAVNHGMPAELMTRALELSAAFFELPDDEKVKVRPVEGSQAPLTAGYGRHPVHLVDRYEYVRACHPRHGLNLYYPAETAGFREAMECYAKLTELGLLIQDILNDCMGLPPGFLKDYNNDRCLDVMVALRYLPSTEEEKIGLSEHEDGSCISFLFQDDVRGLEVLKDGHWIPAEPVHGSIIVNIGDVLRVLSNNKLKSATHRVVRKPVHRHSFGFFWSIHGDKLIEPLPEFTAKIGEAPQYRGFLYNEYMQKFMRSRTHPQSRPEDSFNVSHYAI